MQRFLAAIQFQTIIPARSTAEPGQAAIFFPVVGALLGLAAGGLRTAAAQWMPAGLAAVLALVFLVVATGGLHEDGLADVFDAFRAGRSPERIHAILKDSRIGTYGGLALALSLLFRWQAIVALGGHAVLGLVAAVGASRGTMIALAYFARPAGDGLGKAFRVKLTTVGAIGAMAQAAVLPFLLGPAAGVAALGGNALVLVTARAYFHRHLGGVTGDCLGAVCQISEMATLLVFLIHPAGDLLT